MFQEKMVVLGFTVVAYQEQSHKENEWQSSTPAVERLFASEAEAAIVARVIARRERGRSQGRWENLFRPAPAMLLDGKVVIYTPRK